MKLSWEALSAISAFIQTIIIIITVIFAVIQIKQSNKSHKLEISIRLFDELSTPISRKNRAFLYSLKDIDTSLLKTEEFLIIDEVLSSFDRVWILIENDQLDAKFVYETYGEIFIKIWDVVEPIVIYERTRRGIYYRQRTEELVKYVRKYFKEMNKPLGIIIK